jgi:hypothetical protein
MHEDRVLRSVVSDLYGQPAKKGISRLFFPEEEKESLINENMRPRSKISSWHQAGQGTKRRQAVYSLSG